MRKWKALRDNYVKELKEQKKVQTGVPAKKRKTYIFFEQLSFLATHVHKGERTTSNIGPPQILQENYELEHENTESAEIHDSVTETNQLGNVPERQNRQNTTTKNRTAIAKSIATTTKTLTDILAKSVEQQQEERASDKYGNKSFLMSFLPVMDTLPMNVQMQARFKIAQIFNDYSYMCASTSSSPCPSATSASTVTEYSAPGQRYNLQDDNIAYEENSFDISTYLKM